MTRAFNFAWYLVNKCTLCGEETSPFVMATCHACGAPLQVHGRLGALIEDIRAYLRHALAGQLALAAGGMLDTLFGDCPALARFLAAKAVSLFLAEFEQDDLPDLERQAVQVRAIYPHLATDLDQFVTFLASARGDLVKAAGSVQDKLPANPVERLGSRYARHYTDYEVERLGTPINAGRLQVAEQALQRDVGTAAMLKSALGRVTELQSKHEFLASGIARMAPDAISIEIRRDAGEYRALLRAAGHLTRVPLAPAVANSGGSPNLKRIKSKGR